ncbi:hypothetical protein B0H17DRAFT_922023 [Mycena rosella]|uniref:Uncharacterized protein n=1 Tax=Mycena rosella TaxID=1033263 RepID=A0AAD7E2H0_MYCRO|nr:hypothetical protein B0H17DRAFT_922023 [Mycena rosella]
MPHYPNPAHAHGPRSGQTYSIIQGPTPQSFNFISPTRRRVPLVPYSPTQGWKVVTGRTQPLHSTVSFDYPGQARQGVSMREFRLKGNSTPIQGAGDLVLAHTGLQRIVFRILWPDYGHVEWCRAIPVVAPNGSPITRVALGLQITSNLARFFEKSQYETPTAPDWLIGPSCVRFEHLLLISLQNTFEDVWQADIALDLC